MSKIHRLVGLAVVLPALASAQPASSDAPATTEPAPAEPATSAKPAVTASYDGGLKLASEDGQYEVKLTFKDQVRFTSIRPLDDDSQFLNQFSIVRARFGAEGHFFGEDNRFKLEAGLGDNGSFGYLKDFYVERRVACSGVWFRAGQWKRPFNRAELVSDFASEFNERSIENELAGGGRSIGVAVHNDYEKSPAGAEWVVGVFNTFSGGSDKPRLSTVCTTDPVSGDVDCAVVGPTTLTPDFGPTLVARLGFNSPDMKGYSEADLEGGPLRWAVGASSKIDLANFAEGDQDSWVDNTSHGIELDTMLKAMGYSLEAGVVMMKIKDADPQFGVYAQPGMMLIPKKLQVAGRFALTTVEEATAAGTFDREELEGRVALNYYFHGHAWKFANDFGFVVLTGDEPAEDKPDFQLRMMLQMAI
jgi:hypothetical protein